MKTGELIREQRRAAGHSLRSLAGLVSVDPAYLSRVERNLVPASEALLRSVADVLKVPVDQLFLLGGRVPPEWQPAIEAAPYETASRLQRSIRTRVRSDSPRYPVATAFAGTRAIESEQFPFEHLSEVAEAESWRKEIYRPVYHLHKWWAQRLGSVFRGILLGCFTPKGSDLMEVFYQPVRLHDATVFDPFMGSGTTVGEALKLGARAVGRDINPVAYSSVRNALRDHDLGLLKGEYQRAISEVRHELLPLYEGLSGGQPITGQYYFWVKHLPCPSCFGRVDLFRSYVFSKHAYARKNPLARVLCPGCGAVNERQYDVRETCCDQCDHEFDAGRGPARGTVATCTTCEAEFKIAERVRAVGGPPESRMFAKIWIDETRARRYSEVDEHDLASYAKASSQLLSEKDLWPHVPIRPGYNTDQVLGYGYSHWHQMFNDRQLLVLGRLGARLRDISDDGVRDLLLCAFSGLLEFNNMFTSFKGEGTGAVRHMFSHHILKPERTPFEANPLAESGSGTFEGIFVRRILRAIEYSRDPFELRIFGVGRERKRVKVRGLSEPLGVPAVDSFAALSPEERLYLSVGDSSQTDIAAGAIDAVVTDPPFFDNVHYSELADFFWVWQRHLSRDRTVSDTTRSDKEVQHGSAAEFASRLGSVWRECNRVLAPHGILVFTYHHSRTEGWQSLLVSLAAGGFGVVACHPIKSELSVASPKAQAKSPIDLDIIVVCRVREMLSHSQPETTDWVLMEAVQTATRQVARFNSVGRQLSRNDVLIVVMAHVLRLLSWKDPLADAEAWLEQAISGVEGATDELWAGQNVRHADR